MSNSGLYKNMIRPNDQEADIFEFIREAAKIMPQRPIVRVVGGWVRDKLLNVESDDIDITVDTIEADDFADVLLAYAQQKYGSGQTIMRIIKKSSEAKDDQVKAMRAAQISINGQEIDLVGLRKESWRDPQTGERLLRNPIVSKGTALDDANRRDLTINSIFYRINDESVEDLVGGIDDLGTMTLRTPLRQLDPVAMKYFGFAPPVWDDWDREVAMNGLNPKIAEQRKQEWTNKKWKSWSPEEQQYWSALDIFDQDPVRLLRVLRFYSRYPSSNIEGMSKYSQGPIIKAMQNPEVQRLLTEKLRDTSARGIVAENNAKEFRKIMSGARPAEALRIMYETGLMDNIINLPENYMNLDMDQNNQHHKLSLINHTLAVVKNMNDVSKEYRLTPDERMMMNMAAMFHDMGKLDTNVQGVIHRNPDLGGEQTSYHGHENSSVDVWNKFSNAFKLSNIEKSFVSDVIGLHMMPHEHIGQNADDATLAEFKDTNKRAKFAYLISIADSRSKQSEADMGASKEHEEIMTKMGDIPELPVLLNGGEVMQITGLKPGPEVGKIIGEIRQAQYKMFKDPIEQQKKKARDIALASVPRLLGRPEINDIILQRTGLVPGRPPEGMPGITQFVGDKLRELQVQNPMMTNEEAMQEVHKMIDNNALDPYQT